MKLPIQLIKGDCFEILDEMPEVKCIFADPPDNLGLRYSGFHDIRSDYYNWLELLILKSLRKTSTFWLSFYHNHLVEVLYRVRNILRYRYPSFEAKLFIWRFTFGQHLNTDAGSGFRPILRLKRAGTALPTGNVGFRIESERQRIGDLRANPDGRVPDDVFEFPRVVGNAKERRAWHPTQHPEALMDRIIRLSCLLPSGAAPTWDGEPSPTIMNGNDWGKDQFVDLFAGTGTSIRVCKRLGVPLITCEISESYSQELAREHPDIGVSYFNPVI